MRKKLAIEFWEMDGSGPRLLADPAPSQVVPERRQSFDDRVHELVIAVKAQSAKLHTQAGQAAQAMPDRDADLFLATATKDVAANTRRLKSDLEARGYVVTHFDLTDDNVTAGWDLEFLVNAMKSCNVFVQLAGSVPGKPDLLGSGKSLTAAQYSAAGQAGLKRHVWILPDVDKSECDPGHAEFLDGCDFHQMTFEHFEDYLVKHLEEAREADESAKRRKQNLCNRDDANDVLVAFDFDKSDQSKFEELTGLLDEHIVYFDLITDNLSNKVMSDAVKDNDAIVVIYGGTRGARNRARRHLKKYWQHRRKIRPDDNCELAVGDAAPETARPCPGGRNVHKIDVRKGITPEAVGDFLTKLGVDSAHRTAGH